MPKKLNTKIIISMVVIFSFITVVLYVFLSRDYSGLISNTTKKYINILSDSIFQSVRMGMNSGDSQIVKDTLEDAKKIEGVENLKIYKSKVVIEFFGLNEKESNDKDVRDVLKSKRVKSYDYSKNDKHYYRLLKPLIADDSCIMCHATSKKGDILGVMDLSVSLSDSDSLILSSKTNIIMIVVATSIIGIIIFMIFFKVELFKPLAILRDLSKDLAHGDGDLTKRLNLKKRR